MDGFNTYVLNYQDAAGNVFTARVISNNPEFPHDARAKLEQVYKAMGYEVLSADKVEEVAGTGSAMPAQPRLGVRLYRGMIIGCVFLTLGNIALNIWMLNDRREHLDSAIAQAREERANLAAKLEAQKRLLARIEGRQVTTVGMLEMHEHRH